MSTQEISNESSNVEGETDQENDKIGCDKLPLVPSLRKLGRLTTDFNFDVDNWMKQYVRWTDEQPMFSRCVVSALTASIGVLLARATTRKARSHQRQQAQYGDIGILEIIAFAVHGGFVGGPLSYYIDEYLERKSKDVPSIAKMSSSTYNLLIDQVVMAPPKLYLTFLTVDITKSLLTSVLPNASRKSIAIVASALSDSLRFWPLSIYVLLKFLKKRRHYAAAINLCSIAFSMHLAKKRNIRN